MTRTLIVCLHCREPLAYARSSGALQRLGGVTKRYDRPGVWWFRCPVCRHERRVTVRDEREAA